MSAHNDQELKNIEDERKSKQAEEFPDGPYGSTIFREEQLQNSSEKRSVSAYTYENRQLHAGTKRKFEQAHPPHDER
ncbi:hypothetical protein [Texcoconibacillus texcoconensis]|uniref:Uncharacterized protein n=1 Tax=Texcoconibacillus texcoconensis TaxID=1095777 RepID=A0A840QQB4_9BACI|nr:hypothetical protein [Texcoconibacillus texcoconensis]MBB5173539.1 hypothetical protein [Texcoconibacillus texcoconensis]